MKYRLRNRDMSQQLQILLMAALPVLEVRAALPTAIAAFGMPAGEALFFSVIGSLIPAPIILWLTPKCVAWTQKHWPATHRFIERYFHHLKHKHHERFERLGALALAAFVAVPLPGMGVWTGALLAVLFDIRPAYSIPAIIGGAIAAGVIVLLITQGTLGALSFLL
jgi:uncharacterized membrane protein